MKEEKMYTRTEVLKILLKGMSYPEEDITKVISYLSKKEPKQTEKGTKRPKKVKSIRAQKGEFLENIITMMSENPDKAFTAEEISRYTGIGGHTIRTYMKQLKNSRKVKIVGYEITKPGPATLLYQTFRNPMKALKTVAPAEGYASVNSFVKNNSKLLGKSLSPTAFAYAVEQENLTEYPMALGIGIVKGYKLTELKKLANKFKNSEENKPVKKRAKKKVTQKAKIPEASPESIGTPPPAKGINVLKRLFQKNSQSTSELIKF